MCAEKTSPKNEPWKSYLQSNDLPMSNCVFVVNGEELPAHTHLLTCCSPVFDKMFNGPLAANRVEITDIGLEDFVAMLKFIYTKNVRIKSVLHCWALVYIADKYLLTDFADFCSEYIQKNFTISNLLLNYEYAEMYNLVPLQSVCMGEVEDHIRGVFTKKCDYHMKPSTLVKILQLPALAITNGDLVIGVLNWAITECNVRNVSLSPENVVNLLESQKILKYLVDLKFAINPNSDKLIVKASQLIKNSKNPRGCYRMYSKKVWCTFCKCRQIYKIASRIEVAGSDVIVSHVSVNKNCLLYGLLVVTENEQVDYTQLQYKGSIRIQISEIDSVELINDTTMSEYFIYEAAIYVPLSDVVFLEIDKVYSLKVSYKNFDNSQAGLKSSIVCNYMSNKLIDEKKKVIFSFDELDGSVIKGLSYYPV